MIDTIMLIIKQNLYAARCLKIKPNANNIIREVNFIKNLEIHAAKTNKSQAYYKRKWQSHINESDEDTNIQQYLVQYLLNTF